MALDHKGRLYAWGECNNTQKIIDINSYTVKTGAMNGDYDSHHHNGFESIGKTSERPLRLEMPDLLKSVRYYSQFKFL